MAYQPLELGPHERKPWSEELFDGSLDHNRGPAVNHTSLGLLITGVRPGARHRASGGPRSEAELANTEKIPPIQFDLPALAHIWRATAAKTFCLDHRRLYLAAHFHLLIRGVPASRTGRSACIVGPFDNPPSARGVGDGLPHSRPGSDARPRGKLLRSRPGVSDSGGSTRIGRPASSSTPPANGCRAVRQTVSISGDRPVPLRVRRTRRRIPSRLVSR